MRKLHAVGAKAESAVGMFSKAAELGAFASYSACEIGVIRAALVKAGAGSRAETCRDSLAAQAGCCVRTVSRALSVWQKEKFCRVVKTLTGLVVLFDLDHLRGLSRAVDVVRATAKDLLLSVKEMRAALAQRIEILRKGHDVQSSGHDVPRSPAIPLVSKDEAISPSFGDPHADYLAQIAQRIKARGR